MSEHFWQYCVCGEVNDALKQIISIKNFLVIMLFELLYDLFQPLGLVL